MNANVYNQYHVYVFSAAIKTEMAVNTRAHDNHFINLSKVAGPIEAKKKKKMCEAPRIAPHSANTK